MSQIFQSIATRLNALKAWVITWLLDAASAANGAGAVGFGAALAYAAGTVGFELGKRKSVYGTGVAATDVANIQAAINAAADYTTIELFGTFATNAKITLKPKVKILGNYCTINHSNNAADLFAYTPGAPTGFPGQIIFEKLTINGPGNAGTANAINIDANAPFVSVRHCYVGNFFGGIYLRDCYGSVVDHCQLYTFTHGIRLVRESHASTIRDTLVNGCTVAAVSVNYGGGAGTGPTHNVNVIGGALQNGAVGLWAENCLELHTQGIYHEGNTVNDYRIGVADAGAYLRACYNVVIDGFNSVSPCGTDRNVRIEHSVGAQVRAAAWNTGCSTNSTLLSYDGFSDRIEVDVLRHTTAAPTANAPVDFTADPTRGVLKFRGRLIFGSGATDAIQFGTLGAMVGWIYQQSIGGRNSMVTKSAQDVVLQVGAGGFIKVKDAAGNDQFTFSIPLATANPGAGSKQLWCDTTDGNRVKFGA